MVGPQMLNLSVKKKKIQVNKVVINSDATRAVRSFQFYTIHFDTVRK